MKEIGLILAAATLFCLLVFGAASLAAGWVKAEPEWWRRSVKRRRPRHHD